MIDKDYCVRISTKYVITLIVLFILIGFPTIVFCSFFGIYILIYSHEIIGIIFGSELILLCFALIVVVYFSFRYHLGRVVFSQKCVLLKSPIAKKIEIKWEECVSFGATCKIQSIALPSVAWLYFSKTKIDDKKAFTKAPQSNKNIIYVSVKDNMLEEMKEYMPEHIYIKIYSDLIVRNYPITKN